MADLGDRSGTPAAPQAMDVVKMPDAPLVASRTSPGTVPMKTSGY